MSVCSFVLVGRVVGLYVCTFVYMYVVGMVICLHVCMLVGKETGRR